MRIFIAGLSLVAAMVTCARAGNSQSQIELTQQSVEEYRASDRKLNAVYSRLAAKLSPASKESLQTAQLAWIRFRDQECEFESINTVGGSIHSMMVNVCLGRFTNQRIKDIERQLNCQEGDLSCVHQ